MLKRWVKHPARLVPLAFLCAIAIGTALLMLPIARAGPDPAPFLTALFTSTSAVCVTGLIVQDTSTYWSGFGQFVIMVLFQVGGFGIMSGATLLGLLVSRRLRLSTRVVAQAETRSLGLGDVTSVLKLIVTVTVTIELILAVVLALRLHLGYDEPWRESLWSGLFHSVSAFNNAGFSIYSDSLVGFVADPLMLLPVMLAVVLGGIGFPVLQEIRRERVSWRQWSVHTKLTLFGTAFLLVVGTLGILVSEWNASLANLSPDHKLLAATFHSVVARTAGFNVIDIGAMSTETLMLHYVLMFIGGGSAGTAGGIKVTTFFLLGVVVWAEIRGSRDATMFHRRVATEKVQREALTVVLLGVMAIGLSTMALLAMTDFPLDALLFESVSAFATVGLSTGITSAMPPGGQLILVMLMFMGRVGTITVATALALRARPAAYRYPQECPIVG